MADRIPPETTAVTQKKDGKPESRNGRLDINTERDLESSKQRNNVLTFVMEKEFPSWKWTSRQGRTVMKGIPVFRRLQAKKEEGSFRCYDVEKKACGF